jgi:hypothetical protein
MFMMLKRRLMAAVTILLVCFGASAAPVTYRFTGDIVGTLNGDAVSGSLTLMVTGNTDDIIHPSLAYRLESVGTSTFNLAGVGDFTVTNSAYVFSRPDIGRVGFGVLGLTSCCDIIQIANSVFFGYDMQTALGPVSGPDNPSLADWFNVPTSAGAFTLRSMTNNTFEAIIGNQVPEPGLPALLAVAGGMAWWSSRRKPAARVTTAG